eukprot:scaffold25817_cov65-Phaeocystis_antarctica.AAC.2
MRGGGSGGFERAVQRLHAFEPQWLGARRGGGVALHTRRVGLDGAQCVLAVLAPSPAASARSPQQAKPPQPSRTPQRALPCSASRRSVVLAPSIAPMSSASTSVSRRWPSSTTSTTSAAADDNDAPRSACTGSTHAATVHACSVADTLIAWPSARPPRSPMPAAMQGRRGVTGKGGCGGGVEAVWWWCRGNAACRGVHRHAWGVQKRAEVGAQGCMGRSGARGDGTPLAVSLSSSREVLRRSACASATAPSQPSWLEQRSSSLSPGGQLASPRSEARPAAPRAPMALRDSCSEQLGEQPSVAAEQTGAGQHDRLRRAHRRRCRGGRGGTFGCGTFLTTLVLLAFLALLHFLALLAPRAPLASLCLTSSLVSLASSPPVASVASVASATSRTSAVPHASFALLFDNWRRGVSGGVVLVAVQTQQRAQWQRHSVHPDSAEMRHQAQPRRQCAQAHRLALARTWRHGQPLGRARGAAWWGSGGGGRRGRLLQRRGARLGSLLVRCGVVREATGLEAGCLRDA